MLIAAPFSPSSLLRGSFAPREVVDVRGRADFSGFDPRPERPTLVTLVRPRSDPKTFFVEGKTFCETPPAADFSRFDPRPEPTLAALLAPHRAKTFLRRS